MKNDLTLLDLNESTRRRGALKELGFAGASLTTLGIRAGCGAAAAAPSVGQPTVTLQGTTTNG